MKLGACGRLRLRPLWGTWYRAISEDYLDRRASARHTRTKASRFNAGAERAPAAQILYLSEDHQVPLFEVRALLGRRARPVSDPGSRVTWSVLPFEVELHGVADLCEAAQHRLVGTNHQELTGDWEAYGATSATPDRHELRYVGLAPTQPLGQALFDVPGLEAFLAPSAVVSGARNLVIFPEKLRPASRVRVYDSRTHRFVNLKP